MALRTKKMIGGGPERGDFMDAGTEYYYGKGEGAVARDVLWVVTR